MTAPVETTIAFRSGDLIYRFEAQLAEFFPIGLFPEGIRFHNPFEGRIVAGPFDGARIFGLDQFLLRHDAVGVIAAPEVIDLDGERVNLDVRGYVVPPAGVDLPSLEAFLAPEFEFPNLEFRVTGSAVARTASPRFADLNRTVAVVEGTVNMATGRLEVEARAA
jgi:hypothetical protein